MITASTQWEHELLARARAGDSYAFDTLAREYAPQVYRLALRMLGDEDEAEDLLQETMVRAFRGLRSFRGDASFGTWLYAIASNRCLTRRNWRKRQLATVTFDDLRDPGSSIVDPEEQLINREHSLRVQRLLNALPSPMRLLIVLRYIEGLSCHEIAQVLGCTTETVRVRLFRARAAFRALLMKDMADEEL